MDILVKRLLGVAAVLALTLSACGSSTSGGATTCDEWLSKDLSFSESLDKTMSGESGLSEEQQAILKDALNEADLSTGSSNMVFAQANIIQYCAPDGTGTRPNANSPISNALR